MVIIKFDKFKARKFKVNKQMKYKIILASNSPRRRELLAGLDVNFEVKVLRGIDESYPDDLDAYDVAGAYCPEESGCLSLFIEWR